MKIRQKVVEFQGTGSPRAVHEAERQSEIDGRSPDNSATPRNQIYGRGWRAKMAH